MQRGGEDLPCRKWIECQSFYKLENMMQPGSAEEVGSFRRFLAISRALRGVHQKNLDAQQKIYLMLRNNCFPIGRTKTRS
jgi:hypothetical protein